jgi:hypothetical protein
MTNRARHIVILAALCVLVAPAAAHASAQAVIKDCAQDGRLDHHYSNKDLVQARKQLPSDLNEYSDCSEVIGAAISGGGQGRGSGAGGGKGGGTGGPVASPSATASDHKALNSVAKGRHKPRVRVDGHNLKPGSNGLFHLSRAENGLPLPLLLALIAVAVLATGGVLFALRRRIPALSNLSLPRVSLSRVPFPRIRR